MTTNQEEDYNKMIELEEKNRLYKLKRYEKICLKSSTDKILIE